MDYPLAEMPRPPYVRAMSDALSDLIDDFDFLEDWEDRYMHVIDLGKGLETLSDAERNPATKVEGCASQVWIVSEERDGRIYFRGDSDAHIVKGLIAVVLVALSGKTPDEILSTDVEGIFRTIGLAEHLSTQRANGLKAMVARMRDTARRAAA